MAEEEGGEKTEEPTPKRREEAREEGRILTSKEVFVFATLATGLLLTVVGASRAPAIIDHWAAYLRLGASEDLDAALGPGLRRAMGDVLWAGLVVAIPSAVAVLLAQEAMGGVRIAPKALGFKFSKLNPLKGLQRMVSAQALADLCKAVAKVVLLSGAAVFILWSDLPLLARGWSLAPGAGAAMAAETLLKLIGALTLVLAAIAGADLVWQMHSLDKSLRMSFDEVKRENKETNGSPEVKGRLRRLQMEASRRGARERGALKDVPQATAIVTNPIHFAVALRYVPGETSAPVVIATGRGPMALDIIARGQRAGVPVLPLPPLARALYYTSDIGSEIGDRLFGAVAAVLAHVWRLERGEDPDLPDIDLPPDLRFNAHGRPETEA